MPPTKKKKSLTPDKLNGEPEVIDLDEEEKHMELLIGRYSQTSTNRHLNPEADTSRKRTLGHVVSYIQTFLTSYKRTPLLADTFCGPDGVRLREVRLYIFVDKENCRQCGQVVRASESFAIQPFNH